MSGLRCFNPFRTRNLLSLRFSFLFNICSKLVNWLSFSCRYRNRYQGAKAHPGQSAPTNTPETKTQLTLEGVQTLWKLWTTPCPRPQVETFSFQRIDRPLTRQQSFVSQWEPSPPDQNLSSFRSFQLLLACVLAAHRRAFNYSTKALVRDVKTCCFSWCPFWLIGPKWQLKDEFCLNLWSATLWNIWLVLILQHYACTRL